MIAELYWIHLPEHTDITAEGYIGVTTLGTSARFIHHKRQSTKKSSKTIITKAIRKYGNSLIVDCLCIGEESYIYGLENKLRPKKNIGWNLAVGGEKPFRPVKGTKPSEATLAASRAFMTPEYRKYLSERNKTQGIGFQKGNIRSEENIQKQKDTLANKGPWNLSNVNKEVWGIADLLYVEFSKAKRPSEIINKFDLTYNRFKTILSYFRKGWIPLEDDLWLRDFREVSHSLVPI